MPIKMVKRTSAQVTMRKTVPSETSRNFTDFRFNFGNGGDNTQPGCCFTPSGDDPAKCLPDHPGLTPRQRG